MGIEAKTSDYWIAPNAVTITLNALGNANRIQGSVASGAVISCYMADVKPGGDNGDGLQLDNGRNPRRWPLSLSPTYFNTFTPKYVYAAIPRSTTTGTTAVIVFPSERIDIYGKNSSEDQIGSKDYFYIFLRGIISGSGDSGTTARKWTDVCDFGSLGTYEDLVKVNDSDWYRWDAVTQLTTFLKNLTMKDGTTFLHLIAERLTLGGGDLTSVASDDTPIDSETAVVTPAYAAQRFLSRVADDTAQGIITFLNGYVFGGVGKSQGAIKGFEGGRGIWFDALEGLIETDGMNVRGFMRVMELIVNRLQLMESDYSFTEGDTVERIDYEDNGQTLVLTMHKDHDNDYTPFYEGDILYGKVNDLLPRDGSVPDGHTTTKNGSYYTTWMRVKSVDLATNQVRVALYEGQLPDGTPIVPGATNFSPDGTAITTDVTAPMLSEYNAHGGEGYDTMLTLTRHGNVADSPDAAVKQSQLGRQQSWVLSTTDKRLSFFWNVDAPIIRDDNYALCLGILPDLANLPTTRNPDMPSLYVNTVFYDHQHRANWPAKVVKEDRGQWSQAPVSTYSGFDGEYTPDGTLPATSPYAVNVAVQTGDTISDPYHCRTISMDTWLRYRLNSIYSSYTDAALLQKMLGEWREEVDLEVSRVWNHGALWECLVDGTTQEPALGCTDWQLISGGTFSLGFFTADPDPLPIMGLAVRPANIDETIRPYLLFGQEDISSMVTAWQWERESNKPALDEAWGNTATTDDGTALKSETRTLHLTADDLPTGWETGGGRVGFRCTAIFLSDGEETQIMNSINIL